MSEYPFYADYATMIRESDGATIGLPSRRVLEPPTWTSQVLREMHQRLDWAGIPRVGEWDWPEVPEVAR